MGDTLVDSFELEKVSVRLVKEQPLISKTPICCPEDAVRLVGNELCEYDRECFAVICLRTNGVPICSSICSIGTLDFSIVHPREIFKVAVLANASKLMLVHVHSSGSLVPSRDDVRVTDRLLQLCEMMGIPLLDHVIVAGENKNYFSFREKGILEYKPVKYLKENTSNIPDVKMYVIIGMINRILTVQNSWNQDMSIHIEDVNNGNNSAAVNGAASIVYSNALDDLAKKLNSDLFVLPSSVHEVLAVSTEVGDAESFADMVRSVNEEQVAYEEQLSDHVYRYDA